MEAADASAGMPDGLSRLSLQEARARLDAEDITKLDGETICTLFRNEEAILPFLPQPERAEDPRNALPVFFSEARASRPHSYGEHASDCPVCSGHITRILDLQPLPTSLPEEFCFINKNLYPLAWPGDGSAWGLHFLLWPSNYHHRSFRNMEEEAAAVVLSRLAALERTLLQGKGSDGPAAGNLCIIKNEGARVGGSIAHDHFQMLFTPAEPLRLKEDREFFQNNGISSSSFIRTRTPHELLLYESPAWTVLVPPFMRRPYDLMIIGRDETKSRLHHLDGSELRELGRLLRTIFLASDQLFPIIGRPPAFNLILRGSGFSAPVFEFLPCTQETGGFEQLGLYLSQTCPETAAAFYRPFFR